MISQSRPDILKRFLLSMDFDCSHVDLPDAEQCLCKLRPPGTKLSGNAQNLPCAQLEADIIK